MSRRRSGTIEISFSEFIDELDDDDLLDEVHRRNLSTNADGETTDIEIVKEAYEAIQRGRLVEARVLLDRMLFPKWRCREDCQKNFELTQ